MRILVLNEESQDLAAIEAAIRSGAMKSMTMAEAGCDGRYGFAGWTVDVATRELLNGESQRVHLTSSEFDLLMAFVRQPGRPLSRAKLTNALKGRDWSYFDRSIDTLVARLRKKMPKEPPPIRSVRAVGYVFCAAVSRA